MCADKQVWESVLCFRLLAVVWKLLCVCGFLYTGVLGEIVPLLSCFLLLRPSNLAVRCISARVRVLKWQSFLLHCSSIQSLRKTVSIEWNRDAVTQLSWRLRLGVPSLVHSWFKICMWITPDLDRNASGYGITQSSPICSLDFNLSG